MTKAITLIVTATAGELIVLRFKPSFETHIRTVAALLALIIAGLFAQPSRATIFRVGIDGAAAGCHTTTIQQAVDLAASTPGAHEIRITGGGVVYVEDIEINNLVNEDSLILSGGWQACNSGIRFGRTTIVGDPNTGNSTGAFSLIGSTLGGRKQKRVIFRDLEVTGFTDDDQTAIGMFFTRLDLINVRVSYSSPGVALVRESTLTVDRSSSIFHNTAPSDEDGGGISCGLPGDPASGANTRVFIEGSVDANQGTHGAGILARQGCFVGLSPGARVANNVATGDGGGIYLASGAQLQAGGNADATAEIVGNEALFGAGIYLRDPGTAVFGFNLAITSNVAFLGGGGVAVSKDAFFRLNRSSFNNCLVPPYCAQISANQSNGLRGSALMVESGGRAEILRAFVDANHGTASPGPVMLVDGPSSSLYLEGVGFWKNRGRAVLQAINGAKIDSGFISLARNSFLVDSGGNPVVASWAANSSSGATIEIQSSILEDTRGSAGTGNTGRCLLMDDDSNMLAGNSLVGLDPQYVNADIGELHLAPTSPAIDFCDNYLNPTATDVDLHNRGFDSANLINGIGTLDLGFDEYIGPGGGEPPIFGDGFESGTTFSWSSIVP